METSLPGADGECWGEGEDIKLDSLPRLDAKLQSVEVPEWRLQDKSRDLRGESLAAFTA